VEVKDTATVLDALGGPGWAVNGDALHLPFPDGAFDRVIAAEVLEHIPADAAAIGELARVVRPGGTLAVTVPRWGPELANWIASDVYHLVPGGHVRIYRERELGGRLRAAGLRVTGKGYAHALHSPYWLLRCLVGLDRDDHPLVRAYHQLLVWDIERAPVISVATRLADAALNPVIGKSMVLYTTRLGVAS
jgi:SAM-dependent methyltransferase